MSLAMLHIQLLISLTVAIRQPWHFYYRFPMIGPAKSYENSEVIRLVLALWLHAVMRIRREPVALGIQQITIWRLESNQNIKYER